MTNQAQHISVLEKEVQTELLTNETQTVFDGTLGLGGHARSTLKNFPGIKNYIATDLDPQHLGIAKERLSEYKKRTHLHLGSFSEIKDLVPNDSERPLAILLDLGLCSNHVDDGEKGFSFIKEGPLKMSFDGSNKAEEFLNNASQKEIIDVLREYGEIRNAQAIAKGILAKREESPIKTTTELKKIIEKHTYAPLQKKVLTLAFQAIRIHVNDELEVLKETLEDALEVMQSNDRIGVISYHSLEDRIVKRRFQKAAEPLTQSDSFSIHSIVKEADFFMTTKKPIIPTETEIKENPRARSAKLRILEKK